MIEAENINEQYPVFYCPYDLGIETLKCIGELNRQLPSDLLDMLNGEGNQ